MNTLHQLYISLTSCLDNEVTQKKPLYGPHRINLPIQ